MIGHPPAVLAVLSKIERLLATVDKTHSARRIQAVETGLRRRSHGKTDKQTQRIALKCLHAIRKIVEANATRVVDDHELPGGGIPVLHSQLCKSTGPAQDELDLARRIRPDIDYRSLKCKIARIDRMRYVPSLSSVPAGSAPVQIRCTQCGSDHLVYDAQTDDDICTQCGLAKRAYGHAHENDNTHQPMLSEPIEGHRRAQTTADYFSGLRNPHSISMYTKHADCMSKQQFIEDVCCKLHLGQMTSRLACDIYYRVRLSSDRLEKAADTLVACIIVARRLAQMN